jgi:hypothetical protein
MRPNGPHCTVPGNNSPALRYSLLRARVTFGSQSSAMPHALAFS